MNNTDTSEQTARASLPPHLSAVRYQAEELAMYFRTLLASGIPVDIAERLALAWLDRRGRA